MAPCASVALVWVVRSPATADAEPYASYVFAVTEIAPVESVYVRPVPTALPTASCARSSVKYLLVEPSDRLSVFESATPFSAVIVRPLPLPVMVMLVRVAPVRRAAASVLARAVV